jgi:hypothetical protein
MTPPVTVIVAKQLVGIGAPSLTAIYSDLSFSNVDPGGFEQLQITVNDQDGITVGDTIIVRCGLETAWRGRINEIGPRQQDNRTVYQIAALGEGSKLTDKRLQMIYADRDLARWATPGRARRVQNVVLGIRLFDPTQQPDPTTGVPAFTEALADVWGAGGARVEAWYDAGPGNLIASIYYEWAKSSAAAFGAFPGSWLWQVFVSSDDVATITEGTANLAAAGPGSGTFTPATTRRFGLILFGYTAAGGTAGTIYQIDWSKVAVYGNHGLTKRGSAPEGFYPTDIVGHALTDSASGFTLVADDSSSLIVGHAVYRDPTPHQTVIEDMAKLMGWHWGTWEPNTVLSDTPRLFFTAPPSTPTCVVARNDIADLDAPKIRVDKLYDTAKVKWQDVAGTTGITTVTITNQVAIAAGVTGRTLDLDMGTGDATTATTFGTFALNLALAGARGGGSGTVPATIRLPGGGDKPACLLKSGRDKIRILNLTDSGSLTDSDSNRQDSFLVRRVETTVKNGLPTTRIEFDGGADLLEVLQARLALAATG